MSTPVRKPNVPPTRKHKPPTGTEFDAPYPKTPKTYHGEARARSQAGSPRNCGVWNTSKGIDLEGMIFEPDAARAYAKMVLAAADECDRMRAAEALKKGG